MLWDFILSTAAVCSLLKLPFQRFLDRRPPPRPPPPFSLVIPLPGPLPLPRDSGCGSASTQASLYFPPEGRVGEGEEGDAKFSQAWRFSAQSPLLTRQGWEPCYKGDHKREKGLTPRPSLLLSLWRSQDLALRGPGLFHLCCEPESCALVVGSALADHL